MLSARDDWGQAMSIHAHGGHGAPPAQEIGDKDAEEIFNEVARRKLGISGDEFLRRWDAGKYACLLEEDPRAQEVAMLIPLVRSSDAR
jgi:hypothetical protein